MIMKAALYDRGISGSRRNPIGRISFAMRSHYLCQRGLTVLTLSLFYFPLEGFPFDLLAFFLAGAFLTDWREPFLVGFSEDFFLPPVLEDFLLPVFASLTD